MHRKHSTNTVGMFLELEICTVNTVRSESISLDDTNFVAVNKNTLTSDLTNRFDCSP